MDKIQILLNSLPDNADDIASYFKLQGIAGAKSRDTKCPLANYLRANGIAASVGSCTIAPLDTHYLLHTWVSLPTACADFVNNFDAGLYPDLEADYPDEEDN